MIMNLEMPAISHQYPHPQVSSTTLPASTWNSPLSLGIRRPNISILICFFFIGIALTLYFLRRLIKPTSSHSRCLPTANVEPKGLRNSETLESTWPPASLVTLAPESKNLPSPTIRRNSPSAFILPPPPRTNKGSKSKTWPATGGLLRRETMEEVNGCRRHVMVFGGQA